MHDLTNPSTERLVAGFQGMANMFDFKDGNCIFAAIYQRSFLSLGGQVEFIDLRSGQSRSTLLKNDEEQVKALAVCPFDNNYVAVGVGSEVWLCDSRVQTDQAANADENPCVVEKLTLEGVHELERKLKSRISTYSPSYLSMDSFEPEPSVIVDVFSAANGPQLRYEGTSISCIEFSRQSREMLVSFQGDMLYRFGMDPSKEFGLGSVHKYPTQIFTGHVNDETFLKRASYFGPQEEYVVCGGDDGNVYVYESRSGNLVMCRLGDGFSGQGRGIVNGVAPHPHANCFVSYGLDSTAKLWVVNQDDDDFDERNTLTFGRSAARSIHLEEGPVETVWSRNALAIQRNFLDVVKQRYVPECPMIMVTRCMRHIHNAKTMHGRGSAKDLPIPSLMLEALEDNAMDAWDAILGRTAKVSYCIRKVEQLRERGNELFHEQNFEIAYYLYAVAAHYCLCAEAERALLVRCLRSETSPAKISLLSRMKKIGSDKGSFKISMSNARLSFANIQLESPDLDTLTELCEAFGKIRELLLVMNLNASQAALKRGLWLTAEKCADRSMLIDNSSIKARYRCASALRGQKRIADAIAILAATLRLEGGDTPLIRQALAEMREAASKRPKKTSEKED